MSQRETALVKADWLDSGRIIKVIYFPVDRIAAITEHDNPGLCHLRLRDPDDTLVIVATPGQLALAVRRVSGQGAAE